MDYDNLPVSDGNGDAALAHVTADRLVAATTIEVDSVVNWPEKFIATYGTLDANNQITAASKRDFIGHLSGADIIIDAFAPGSTDNGNVTNQVVIIKPNTHWADLVAQFILNAKNFGTPEAAWFAALEATTISGTGLAIAGNGTVSGALGVSGNLTGINPYSFMVYRAAAYNWGLNTDSIILFDTEEQDRGNCYNPANGRFTAPVEGDYDLDATVGCQTISGSGLSVKFYKNGAFFKMIGSSVPVGYTGGFTTLFCGGMTVHLAAGDYIQVAAYGNNNIGATGAGHTWFSGHLAGIGT